MAEKIPPEVQNKLVRLQQLQEQLRLVLVQKQSAELELREVSRVAEEVSKLEEKSSLYKSIGHVLLKTDRESVLNELNDRKEVLELRIKTLSRQEEYLSKQIEDLRRKVAEALGGQFKGRSAG